MNNISLYDYFAKDSDIVLHEIPKHLSAADYITYRLVFRINKDTFYARLKTLIKKDESNDHKTTIYIDIKTSKPLMIKSIGSKGFVTKATYRNGKQNGPVEVRNSKGQLCERLNYVNNEIHGLYEEYNPRGRLIMKTNFAHGKQNGPHIVFNHNGTPRLKCNYINGELDGLYERWNINGDKLIKRCNYINGKLNSLYEEWDSNGTIVY